MSNGYLKEGDIIELNQEDNVYVRVPKHMVYSNELGNWDLVSTKVNLAKTCWTWLRGKYIVYRTAVEGGGSGHGPFDNYPDGHHVFCHMIDFPRVRVDFYQSGCFTCMLPDKKPIARAKAKWTVVE